MWTYDDGLVGHSAMDRRVNSYGVGLDGSDPLGCVDLRDVRAAKVRRRCRSEGLETSPYDGQSRYEASRPAKSQFTLNSGTSVRDRFLQECFVPAPENGDFVMAPQHNASSQERSKNRSSPNRLHSNTKIDKNRLPKVEELFERVDHTNMMEVTSAKQPLKSILNHPPTPKSPPQSILKKPKSRPHTDSKSEGRRRQRAASESDNLYCNFHLGCPIPGYDSRLTYLSSNTKRAKDNTGGYSYGSAVAMTTPAISKSPHKTRCQCKDQVLINGNDEGHILRTTAINEKMPEDNVVEMPNFDPAYPLVSQSAPVESTTTIPSRKPSKKKVKKCKSPKCKRSKGECQAECEANGSPSSSPSPDADNVWQMETDALVAEIDKLEKILPSTPAVVDKKPEENGKSSTKLTNGSAVLNKKMPVKEDSPLHLQELGTNCLRPSLFPRVPPYLKFVGHEDTMLKVPAPIQRHLKWKLTTITPIVVKKTLTNSGFRLVKSDCDTAECPQEETVEWIGIWGKHMKSLMFRAIKDGQKMNHFPGTFQIGRKDRLWRNLQKLVIKHGIKEFGIMPKTYVLPHDLKLLKHEWERYAADNEKWIIKPPASARGTGIKVVSRWTQIPKKRPVVVQRYVSKPYLINGSKFDMRLYVLVTSIHPLRIYLFKDGLARFASVKYNDELSSLNDRYMHLTNYSINRLSKNYTPNEDFAACEGHKWTLQSLFHYLKTEKLVDTEALWDSLKDLCIKTIICGEASISSLTKANITSRYNCYELFGIDVLLDEELKPWLLEVNISPSLHSASPLDTHVKGPLVSRVLNIAQFQVPLATNLEALVKEKPHKLTGLPYDSRLYTIYLSKEERDKHIIYTNMEERDMYLRDILSTLTPDDVRHLIQAEDELTQAGDMERIFPSHQTHKYLNYLNGARYYNRLFDAWETRYHRDRAPGLDLLRNLCDIGYHLEVPPVPLKREMSAVHRCRMTSMPLRRPCPNVRPSYRSRLSRQRQLRARSRPSATCRRRRSSNARNGADAT